MSKLIGTSPNQVPSNADLGTAAFMDKREFLLSRGSELSAVDAVINKNLASSKSVYIYDTTYDTDGGAWRKRVSDTEWYNEPLNTDTRGSRRDFPVVAVIVVESDRLTIFDADDPTLPMWMVFNIKGGGDPTPSVIGWYTSGTPAVYAVAMSNGKLVTAGSGCIVDFDFIKDKVKLGYGTNSYHAYENLTIRDRNVYARTVNEGVGGTNGWILPSTTANDVSMISVPESDIDPETGIHYPTIAVATNSGLGIIYNNKMYHRTESEVNLETYLVDFTGNGTEYVYAHGWTNAHDIRAVVVSDGYITETTTLDYGRIYEDYETNMSDFRFYYPPNSDYPVIGRQTDTYAGITTLSGTNYGTKYGLTRYDTSGMIAHITSSYNTGWMPKGITLATLADAREGIVTDTNYVQNGTFDTDISGWSSGVWSSGQLMHNDAASWKTSGQEVKLEVGRWYTITWTQSGSSARGIVVYGDGMLFPSSASNGSFYGGDYWYPGVPGTYKASLWVASPSVSFNLVSSGSDTVPAYFDNVSIVAAEADRTPFSYSLEVTGDIHKNAVAPGADLVAYSNFSTTNYLRQQFNSAHNFGADDYTVMGWFNSSSLGTSGYADIVSRGNAGEAGWNGSNVGSWFIQIKRDVSGIQWYQRTPSTLAGSGWVTFRKNTWNHIAFVRKNGWQYVYLNGEYVTSNNIPDSLNLANDLANTVRIGWQGSAYSYPSTYEQLTLWKFAGTAISGETLKKLVRSESKLFNAGAKSTLDGTTDMLAVSNLDEDRHTKLLHVGTANARHVFDGLVCVDTIDTGVTTAIAAHRGMVVEK